MSLAEEKQILREIKQLEGTRDKVIANAAMRTKLQDSLGQKEVIQDQVKVSYLHLISWNEPFSRNNNLLITVKLCNIAHGS